MPWLGPAVAAALIGNVVLLLVYAYLLSVDRSRHLWLWTAAWLAGCMRYAGAVVSVTLHGSRSVVEIEHLFALASAWFLLLGTYAFVDRRLSRAWHVVFAGVAAWQVAVFWFPQPFLAETLPTFVLLGASSFAIAAALWRRPVSGGEQMAARLLALVFVIWGLHRLDYPWLRPIPGVAPYGFAFAAALELMAAAGTAIAHFERLRSELSTSEHRFRALVENSPQGIYSTSPDGRILDANPALAQMLGYASPNELRELDMARDVWADPAERAVLTKKTADVDLISGAEAVWRRKDGEHVRVAIHGRKIRGASGEVVGYQGVVVDETERHHLEQRVRQVDRLNALGRLAGGVAHDFNNLLTVIQGGAELAGRVRAPETDRQLALEHVQEAAERAATLTRELLSMSRGQALEPHIIDIGDAVVRSAGVLGRLVGEDIDIVTQVEGGPFTVFADPSKIDQVLLNLAANARDAMPHGGRLTLIVDAKTLGAEEAKKRGVEAQPYVRLRVRDEGEGMDAETRARAFDPFFTTKGGGTGLGLATVYGVVLQSGGHIDLHSDPGSGTTFEILFPRDEGPRERVEAAPPSRRRSEPGRRVLVAEDEPLVRNMVVRILRAAGYEVAPAGNGVEALAVADAFEADLLLTDVVMPEMGGPDLCRAMRRSRPRLPVVFMSGYPEGGDVPTPSHFLAKPFSAEALLTTVDAAVSGASRSAAHSA